MELCATVLTGLLLVFLHQSCVLGAITCVQDFELRSYEKVKTYTSARTVCQNYGGNLVKIDSVTIANALREILGSFSYYIGLKRNGDKYYWQDGTTAPNSGESGGYSNWDFGVGRNECVIADGSNEAKWKDVPCHHLNYFICQTRVDLSVNIDPSSDVNIPPGDDLEILCYSPVPTEVHTPTVTWYNGTKIISTSPAKFYQKKFNTSSVVNSKLVFKDADPSQAGKYSCKVHIGPCWSKNVAINVSVPVPPTIDDVTTWNCTSSVNISWTPNSKAIELYHMLKTFPTSYSSAAKEIRFEAATSYTTTLNDLMPSTQYTIQISACERSPCSYKHSTSVIVITGGVPQPVTSPKLTSNGTSCDMHWRPPATIGAEITSYLITVTTSYQESRGKILNMTQNYTVTNDSYIFTMKPNTKHDILIQAVTCAGPGNARTASGTCIASPTAPDKIDTPTLNQNISYTDITIPIPNESNGLISCIFVVVADGESTNSSLEEYIHETLKVPNDTLLFDKQILKAIPYSRIAGNQSITLPLGDDSTSSCNMFDTGYNNTKSVNTKNFIVIAKNRKITLGTSNRVYVLAAAPYYNKVFLQRSEDAVIISETTTAVTESTLTKTTDMPTTTVTVHDIFTYMIDIRYFAGALIIIPMLVLTWKLGSCSGAKKGSVEVSNKGENKRSRKNEEEKSKKAAVVETPPENIYDQVAMSEPSLDTRQPDTGPQTSRAVDNSYTTTEIASGYVNHTVTNSSTQGFQPSTALYDLPPLAANSGYTTMRPVYANATQLAASRSGDHQS